jgi:hypothetical protein
MLEISATTVCRVEHFKKKNSKVQALKHLQFQLEPISVPQLAPAHTAAVMSE